MGWWDAMAQAVQYQAKVAAQTGAYVTKAAATQQSALSNIATQQAAGNAANASTQQQAQATADAQAAVNAQKQANDEAVNQSLQRQARASMGGLAGNILSGGRGFNTNRQNVSSILLGQ